MAGGSSRQPRKVKQLCVCHARSHANTHHDHDSPRTYPHCLPPCPHTPRPPRVIMHLLQPAHPMSSCTCYSLPTPCHHAPATAGPSRVIMHLLQPAHPVSSCTCYSRPTPCHHAPAPTAYHHALTPACYCLPPCRMLRSCRYAMPSHMPATANHHALKHACYCLPPCRMLRSCRYAMPSHTSSRMGARMPRSGGVGPPYTRSRIVYSTSSIVPSHSSCRQEGQGQGQAVRLYQGVHQVAYRVQHVQHRALTQLLQAGRPGAGAGAGAGSSSSSKTGCGRPPGCCRQPGCCSSSR